MEIKFNIAKVNGEKVTDMSVYADAISGILFEIVDDDEIFTIDESGFSLGRIPALNKILVVEQKLVSLGLMIDALSA